MLSCLDFDGTVADTLTPSPNNIDVERGYLIAVEEVFGRPARERYEHEGGLRNRAPIEVVQQLARGATDEEQHVLHTKLDAAKLGVLVNEISPTWPRPIPGFEHYVKTLNAARRASVLIDTAIVSSGHASFIDATFRTWGIFEPTFMLEQDAMRAIAVARNEVMPFKPDSRIFGYATLLWRNAHKVPDGPFMPTVSERRRMHYIGDGDVDEQLAKNAAIPFFRIHAANTEHSWRTVSAYVESLHAV